MEELTIEEKAARYDKAIDIARKINSGEGVAAPSGWTTCEVIFPELKESEDERIRKELIEFVKSRLAGFPECDKFIAWLEKQSKIVAYYEDRLDECACKYFNKGYKQALERQGEKSIDKVEPKFKVGDWVVQENNGVYKVIKVRESWYEVANNKDCSIGFISFNKGCICHLWTIKDAKDGDVLAFKDNVSGIIICKSPTNYDTGSYCRVVSNYFVNREGVGWDSTLFVPATKEQRDTLFKAMADAGYTFDFKNKKLNALKL